MAVMGVLGLAMILVPFIPGVREVPRRIPIYKLIWREHYGRLPADRVSRVSSPLPASASAHPDDASSTDPRSAPVGGASRCALLLELVFLDFGGNVGFLDELLSA